MCVCACVCGDTSLCVRHVYRRIQKSHIKTVANIAVRAPKKTPFSDACHFLGYKDRCEKKHPFQRDLHVYTHPWCVISRPGKDTTTEGVHPLYETAAGVFGLERRSWVCGQRWVNGVNSENR